MNYTVKMRPASKTSLQTPRSTYIKNSILPAIKAGFWSALLGAGLGYASGKNGGPLYSALLLFLVAFSAIAIEGPVFRGGIRKWRYLFILIARVIAWFLLSLVWSYAVFRLYIGFQGIDSVDDSSRQIVELGMVYDSNSVFEILIAMFIAGFLFQVKTLLGKGVLLNYIIGRYHKPRIEEKIFMFLDVTSATTIAEQLGPQRYSAFLRDFFLELDTAIVKFQGRVIQYVGDEVVVIWPLVKGTNPANCIDACFYGRAIIAARADEFRSKYGIIPQFKAALHCGEVTVTEVGSSKKEIAYHGDTINTTSRICSMCHTLDRTLLLSANLLQRLDIEGRYIAEDLGEHELKGKRRVLRLCSIDPAE